LEKETMSAREVRAIVRGIADYEAELAEEQKAYWTRMEAIRNTELERTIARDPTFARELSLDDKRDLAQRIYSSTPASERPKKEKHLAKIFSVSERTVRGWLRHVR
jgi:hypothetical protein